MEREWPLILFTFFVCASSGTLLMQGVLTLRGKGKKMQLGSLLTSLILLVIGGIAVFMHLQHWERMFNGFGHITSGITQEVIGVVLMAVAIVLFFMFMRRSEDGMAPKWTSIASVVVPIFMVFIMAHSYNMPARVAWDTIMLEVFYLVNMVLMGALVSLVVAYASKSFDGREMLAKVAFVAAIVQVVVVVAYAVVLNLSAGAFANPGYYFDPTLPDVAMTDPAGTMASVFAGGEALMFWLGAVVCLGVVPAVLMFLLLRKMKGQELPAEAPDADAVAIDEPLGKVIVAMLKSIPAGIKAAVANTTWQTWVSILGVAVGSLCWRVILYDTALTVFAIFLH